MGSVRAVTRRSIQITTVAAGVLMGMVTPVAAQGMGGGWEPTGGHILRTVAHLVGITGGIVMIYLLYQIRAETRGSVLAKSSTYVIAGTILFVLTFLGMEANHLLGIDLWYFAKGMALTQTWYMIALTTMMLLYALGFRTLIREVGA